MTRYDAIVIGGGINGLVAGGLLAQRGKSVCIVEQQPNLGGMATLSLEDAPPLAHTLYNLNQRVLRDIGLDAGRPPFHAEPIPSVSLCPSGNHVVMRGGKITFADTSPHPDATATERMFDRLSTYGALLRQLAEAPPPGGTGGLSAASLRQLWRLGRLGVGLKRLGKPEMRRFLQVLFSNAHDLILDELSDGPLAGLLAADAVRGAATGPRSPGTVLNLIYRLGHGGEITAPIGGLPAVIETIEQAVRKSGCEIRTDTRIRRILIDGDRAIGVETAGGTLLSAPLVLASISPKRVIELTGPDHEDIETTRRISNIRARGTTAKINLKLDGRLSIPGVPDELSGARIVVAPSVEYVETAFNPAKYGRMSKNPVIEAVQTRHQGADWLSLIVQYAPFDLAGGWTDAARQDLLTHAIETLCRIAPDLRNRIVKTQVLTPDQIEAATGAPGGHWHHAEMALDQLLTLRPANGLSQYGMGPKGLFLCGAAAHPGGDVMGLAGRNAALTALEAAS